MRIVKDAITIPELAQMAKAFSGVFVKAVVDIEKEIMAVDAELHMDLLSALLEQEQSEPKNIWGINIYPEKSGEDFIEFDSMVNVKPGLGNRTRGVESEQTQQKIKAIVAKLIS